MCRQTCIDADQKYWNNKCITNLSFPSVWINGNDNQNILYNQWNDLLGTLVLLYNHFRLTLANKRFSRDKVWQVKNICSVLKWWKIIQQSLLSVIFYYTVFYWNESKLKKNSLQGIYIEFVQQVIDFFSLHIRSYS